MYRRFGAEVTVIEKGPRLTSREDEDVSAAIKEILEKEGIAIELDANCDLVPQAGQRFRGDTARRRRPHRRLPPACRDRTAAQHRRPRPGDRGRADRRPRQRRRRRPVPDQRRPHLGDGRLQRQGRVHPHLVQRLRDRGRQPARRRPAPDQRPRAHLRALHRPAAGPRRHDRRPGARVGPKSVGGQAADDPGRARGREGGDAGLHEGRRRRRDQGDSRRRDPRRRRRRGHPRHPRHHVGQGRPTRRSPARCTSTRRSASWCRRCCRR